MSYAEGTPERELQDAMDELNTAVEKVARLNGSVPEEFYIQDWALIGGATRVDHDPNIIMFAIPGTPMATYQLHGLLDLADKWLVTGENALPDYEGDPDDEGSLPGYSVRRPARRFHGVRKIVSDCGA